MSFAMIESFNAFTTQISTITRILRESINVEKDSLLVETADGVLTQLYTALKSGGQFSPQESEDYAQVLTGLSILSIDDNRQAYNIDISTEDGQQKFLNVMDHVGENKSITAQLRRIATEETSTEYKKNLRKIEQFRRLSPSEQQQFMVDVNKLRIGYRKFRDMLANGEFQQKRDKLEQQAR